MTSIQEVMVTKVARGVGVAAFALAALALSACGGGSGGSGTVPTSAPTATPPPLTPTPPPTPTPGPPGPSSENVLASEGSVNGKPDAYTPTFGNMPSGGQGAPVDGVPCMPVMPNAYHIHVFLGVYDNGTYVALPYGTGMVNPQPPVNGFVGSAQCFYYNHTHDSSGIIHIEDPDLTGAPISQSLYTLKTYLDIWGVTADATHFGPFRGPVRVFTSGQVFLPPGSAVVHASTYAFYGPNPTNIPLYSHEVIWVEVGPNFPASLPNIRFYY